MRRSPAPDPDDEVHRDEHHLPHHVEQEEVERHEHAEHAGREHEQQRVVRVRLPADATSSCRATASSMMNVVSSTIISAMPSMPEREADAPRRESTACRTRCCQPAVRRVERPPEPEREHELEREDERWPARADRVAAPDATSSSPSATRRPPMQDAPPRRAAGSAAAPGGSSGRSRSRAGSARIALAEGEGAEHERARRRRAPRRRCRRAGLHCEPIADGARASRPSARVRRGVVVLALTTSEPVDQAGVDAAPEQAARDADDRAARSPRRTPRPRSTCSASTRSNPSSAGACAFGTSRSGLSRAKAKRDADERDERPPRR